MTTTMMTREVCRQPAEHNPPASTAPPCCVRARISGKKTKKKDGDKPKGKKKAAEGKKKPTKAAAAAPPRASVAPPGGARGLPPQMGGLSRGVAPGLSSSLPGGLKNPMTMDFGDEELSMSDMDGDLEIDGDDAEMSGDAPPLRDPARGTPSRVEPSATVDAPIAAGTKHSPWTRRLLGLAAGGGTSSAAAGGSRLMGGPGALNLSATAPARPEGPLECPTGSVKEGVCALKGVS